MADLNVKLNEKIQKEVFTTARPSFLSADQIDVFSDVIKTNSPFLQDQIKELKTSFPSEFGDIEALTEDQINDFTSLATDELQEKLSLYEKIALPDVTSISSTTGFTVIAADPNSARFFERTDTAMKNFFKIASEVDNFNLDLSGELSKLTKID